MRIWKPAGIILAGCLVLCPTHAFGYIDPNTTQTVVSSLGAVLAAIGAGFVFVGAFFKVYMRKVIAAWKWAFAKQRAGATFAVLAGVILSTYSFLKYLPNDQGGSMAAKPVATAQSKNMIILGVDGMDPKLTRQFIDEGKLPHFAKLEKTGDFKPLMTVNPVQSPVVWATMATGVGPGVHGITDFITRKENGYVPELSLVKQNDKNLFGRPSAMFAPPVSPNLFFWEKLAAENIDAKVIRWPLTFPAGGSAKVLAGLGTPDLLGGMGAYTIFTTSPSEFPEDVKGSFVKLEFKGETASTKVKGPKKSGLTGVTTAEIPLTIRKVAHGHALRIDIGNKSWTLQKNELSPWIPLAFPIGFASKMTGMVQFMPIETEGPIHLYMSPIQIDPLHPAFPVASEAYGEDMATEIGRFHTLGMAEDTNALSDEVIDEDQFMTMCDSNMDESEKMFFRELKSYKGGLYSFVFDTLDRVQHMFWRFQDPKHPLYDAELAARYGKVIESHYIRMDKILGKLMQEIEGQDTMVMVVSDHGFTSYRRNFHANAWLIEMGYMHLKPGYSESDGLFQAVDWSKTKAFALGFSQIFINVKGRDSQGIVDPKDVAKLKEEITFNLSQAMDSAESHKAVSRVYDTTEVYGVEPPLGPDLLVGMESGYRFSWQTAVGAVPAFTFEDNDKRWSGDHCVDPEHVPGVIFSNRHLGLEHPSVFDIAPTTLEYFGIHRMKGMIGKNLLESRERHAHKATL